MMTRAAILSVALAWPGFAGAQALEFKGTPFGASLEQFRAQHPEFHCSGGNSCHVMSYTCASGATSCLTGITPTTFAAEPASWIGVDFTDGALATVFINFRPDSYAAVSAALAEKYGKPAVSTATVSNLSGFSTTNTMSDWKLPDGSMIHVSRYGSTIDKGIVLMRSAAEVKRSEEAAKAKSAKRKGDV